jgi:hypothetical protein
VVRGSSRAEAPETPADSLVRRLLGALDAIAARSWAAIAIPALLALAVCLAGAASSGIPKPTIHDEFSYLLAADTFARGRLTNPTHPMWMHFETMHVVHQPTYQSMYPPGQGLLLAIGQRLGHPVIGVWIGVAAMTAAFVWMLQAWLPPRWALIGGVLTVAKLVMVGQAASYLTVGYWSRTYWGGALAAFGGALLYGALRRIVERPRVRDALIMTAGLGVLAVTRPLEGFMASLPAAAVLLVWLVRKRGIELRRAARRVVVPVVLGLMTLSAGVLYYNHRVTGDALKMPWMLHHEQYGVFPVFLFQSAEPPPAYRHDALRKFHTGWELSYFERGRTKGDLVRLMEQKAGRLWRFYFGPVFVLPLLMLPWVLRDPWMRLAAAGCLAVGVTNFLTVFLFPHYSAPAACLVFVLMTEGLRRLSQLRVRDRPLGATAAAGVVLAAVFTMLFSIPDSARAPTALARLFDRAHLIEDLEHRGGKHLIIVRYEEPHAVHEEWVFNGADLDHASVLFARDMGEDGNRELLEYYSDRTAWLLVVGDTIARPAPVLYETATPPA